MQEDPNSILRSRSAIIGTIATVHLLLYFVVFLASMGSAMARFDGIGPPNFIFSALKAALATLSFPFMTAATSLDLRLAGILGWIPAFANSLLWGWAGWLVIRFCRARRIERQASQYL